jgi:hypothetical protein
VPSRNTDCPHRRRLRPRRVDHQAPRRHQGLRQRHPRIGGAFDLTDSVILTAPAAYILFAYLLRL